VQRGGQWNLQRRRSRWCDVRHHGHGDALHAPRKVRGREVHVAQSLELSLRRTERILQPLRGGHGLCLAPWGTRPRSANTTS
jgi:hypothetical protein